MMSLSFRPYQIDVLVDGFPAQIIQNQNFIKKNISDDQSQTLLMSNDRYFFFNKKIPADQFKRASRPTMVRLS